MVKSFPNHFGQLRAGTVWGWMSQRGEALSSLTRLHEYEHDEDEELDIVDNPSATANEGHEREDESCGRQCISK